MRNNGFNNILCIVVIKTKFCTNTLYIVNAITIPNTYKEQYAQRSRKRRNLGCTEKKRKTNDRTMGSKLIISFNLYHLDDNIAEILAVYSLQLVHKLKKRG